MLEYYYGIFCNLNSLEELNMFEPTDNPFDLIYTKSPEYSSTSAYYIEGYVRLGKFGFTQSVVIHYTYDHKAWFISYATFLTATKDNHEVWYFRTPNTYSHSCCSFALCYKVDGEEYWDNNQNMNYNLKWYFPTKILKSCAIVLDKAFKNSTAFYGNILIKNLAYHKQVKVHYTFDQWETFNEVDAVHFFQFSNDLEEWTFSVLLSYSCKIIFTVYYIVDGSTYFDNNFGRDYLL